MKLKIQEFEDLAKRKGYVEGKRLMKKLGAGFKAYGCIKGGSKLGYELAKNLYNLVGEAEFVKVIDFEEDTLNGFKHKYVLVGDKLY